MTLYFGDLESDIILVMLQMWQKKILIGTNDQQYSDMTEELVIVQFVIVQFPLLFIILYTLIIYLILASSPT